MRLGPAVGPLPAEGFHPSGADFMPHQDSSARPQWGAEWTGQVLLLLEKEKHIFLFFLNFLPYPLAAAAAAKLLQSCPTLCDPIDGSPSVSPVPGILQARTLEWAAISFSNAWKWKVKVKSLSRAWLFTTPWTAAYQAPPSMGFSRQEYWSGVPLPSPPIPFQPLLRICCFSLAWSWSFLDSYLIPI